MAKNNYSLISSLQLAKICGVSQGTIDRALNDRPDIKPETKQRVLEAAKKYGYIPNVASPHIVGSRSKLYGIVLFNLYNNYFSQFIMDFDELCQSIGYNSIIMFSHNDLQTEIGCINQLVHLGVDGIVLCSVGQSDEYNRYLSALNLPIVTIGNKVKYLPFVGIDDFRAMRDLVNYEINANPDSDFYYFAPVLERAEQENIYCQTERHRAFKETVEHHKKPYSTITDPEELLSLLKKSKSSVVICATDHYAIQVSQITRENNIENVKVTGFDNCEILKKLHSNIDSLGFDRKEFVNTIYRCLCEEEPKEFNYIAHNIVSYGK
jgi:DNA-binding LacI/PurR family transcriptional regulator